jgi:hypothetical protein
MIPNIRRMPLVSRNQLWRSTIGPGGGGASVASGDCLLLLRLAEPREGPVRHSIKETKLYKQQG